MKPPKDRPPELPGFTYIRGIAAGGFADVFLYQQHQPRMQVALKVVQREHVSPYSRQHFEHEANAMAEVSDHTNIVRIFASGVAPEPDGRPYIVMEYCPGERFDIRSRGGHLGVPAVLDTGIQIASAVETAHRANIFHRDLKPENILTTRNNRPALTDFGISAVRREGVGEGAAGYTPQFAPPEVIRDPFIESTPAIDTYSLGATLFYLLEGRAAYFVHGGANDRDSIEERTKAGPVPLVERADVPPALRNLIRNAMSPDPRDRPVSALAFAQALQDIQQSLHLPLTEIEVFDVSVLPEDFIPMPTDGPSGGPWPVGGSDNRATVAGPATPAPHVPPVPPVPPPTGAAGATVAGVSGVADVAPDHATVAGVAPRPTPTPTPDQATVLGPPPVVPPPAPSAPSTPSAPASPTPAPTPRPPAVVVRTSELDEEPAPVATRTGTRLPPAAIAALAVVVLVIVAAVVIGAVGGGGGGSTATTETTGQVDPVDPVGTVVAPPTEVDLSLDADEVPVASWNPPADQDSALTGFRVAVFELVDGALEPAELEDGKAYFDVDPTVTTASLPVGPAGGTVYCVQVQSVSDARISDAAPPTPACLT